MSLLKRGEGFEKSLAAIAMLSIVALAAILVFLLTQALPIFNEVSLFTFLLGTEWYPTGPNPDFEIGALLAASLAVAATTRWGCSPQPIWRTLQVRKSAVL